MSDANELRQDAATGDQCEFCGRGLKLYRHVLRTDENCTFENRWSVNSLESAHILASKYAPGHPWNTINLCPNCHQVFDHVIKPKIVHAIKTAMEGFAEPPSNGSKDWIIPGECLEIVCKLMAEQPSQAISPQEGKRRWPEKANLRGIMPPEV